MSIVPTVPLPAQAFRLRLGDTLPGFGWRDTTGAPVAPGLHGLAGGTLVLFACGKSGASAVSREIAKFAELADKFRAAGAIVAVVSADPVADNAATANKLKLMLPLLSDPGFAFGRALGLDPAKGPGWAVAFVDARSRLAHVIDGDTPGRPAVLALSHLQRRQKTRSEAGVITEQAPVLIVPRLLEPEHCARLIAYWEAGNKVQGRVDNDRGVRQVLDEDFKVRDDVFLPDFDMETQAVFDRFRECLLPEVQRAFHYRITRVETLRIGCYDGARQGHFNAHRDNTVPSTAHRRFAMSLNLNSGDYEGGTLRFPEYGPQLYRPETGGAVIFSCSLLHEAMAVTRGRRFGIFGFFFGEAEEAQRYRANPSFVSTRIDVPLAAPTSSPP